MKKIFCLFLSICLIYLAGMYRYLALMVLAVGQMLLVVFSAIQVYSCRRRVQAGFEKSIMAAEKDETFFSEIFVNYEGEFPPGKLRLFMKYGYGEKKKRKSLCGTVNEKTVFSVCPAYCGMAEVRLDGIRVYDSFSIGSAKRKLSDCMRVMVFPRERALDIQDLEVRNEEGPEKSTANSALVLGRDELRQIRGYREGDSPRHLHWKLSARMDELLVREYEQEDKGRAELFLDLDGQKAASLQEKDAFYELLSALLLGLLKKRASIQVCWQARDFGEGMMEITNTAQCRELLAKLYILAADNTDEAEGGDRKQTWKNRYRESLVLDSRLRLFQGSRLLYQFSKERLEEEIQKKTFIW